MRQKHALIVDDSRTATAVLRRMLEDQGLFVETAGSAERALDYLSHARPDVIFMDHMMPGMDGFQAVRAIKNNPATATIPIMMYTSQAGDLYVGQARALGALGVLAVFDVPLHPGNFIAIPLILGHPEYPAHLEQRRKRYERFSKLAYQLLRPLEGVRVNRTNGAFYMSVAFADGLLHRRGNHVRGPI